MVTVITALKIVVQMVEKSCGEDKMLWRGKRCVEKERGEKRKICTRQESGASSAKSAAFGFHNVCHN